MQNRIIAMFAIVMVASGVVPSAYASPPDLTPRDGVLDRQFDVVWQQVLSEEECLVGAVIDAVRGVDGSFYLLDYKLSDVKVFDAQGRFFRTLSRKGEGPGETEQPTDLVLPGDGRLGIMQRFPFRLVWIDLATGDPAGALEPFDQQGESLATAAILGVVPVRDGLVAAVSLTHFDEDRIGTQDRIVHLDGRGRSGAVYDEKEQWWGPDDLLHYDECGEYRWSEGCWTAAPDGRVFSAPERDRFLVQAWGADGTPLWECERAYSAPPRDEVGLKRAEGSLRAHGFTADNSEVCDRSPVTAALHWGDQAEVWVQLDLGGAGPVPGTIAWFDVLSDHGDYVRQERWRGEFDLIRERWFRLDDHSVLVLRTDDDGKQTLRHMMCQ